MIPVSHVVLHLGMCRGIARLAPQTQIAMRVLLTDRLGNPQVKRAYRITRGDDAELIVTFNAQRGLYHLEVTAPQYDCSASDFLTLLPGLNRSVQENLHRGAVPPPTPMLLDGTAPPSFLYAQPTFVVFNKSTAICNKPIGPIIPTPIVTENDQNAFYVWLPTNPSPSAQGTELIALRLRTATGEDHYVRLPITYPRAWGGWPSTVTFDVTEGELDDLAGKPVNTLLCPKLLMTSVYD